MSKPKSKSSKGVAPAQDVLTKVKDAAITKPAQTMKAKSKEIAKQVASKEEKKSKLKRAKEPTPESSDAESEVSDAEEAESEEAESEGAESEDAKSEDAESGDESEESASSENSESEEEAAKPVKGIKANGTANSVPKPSKKADSDSESASDNSEVDSDESESSEDEKIVNGVQNKASAVPQANAESSDEDEDEDDSDDDSDAGVATAKAVQASDSSDEEEDEEDDDEEEDDDSDDESEAEEPLAKNKGPVKAEELSKKLNPIAADSSSDEDSDEESEDSEEESSDDEEEAKPTQPAKTKRKAEDVAAPAAKKSKTTETGPNDGPGGNLFVGNLSWNVDEEWLTREFEEFGELTRVRIITDRATGRSKGYGYVEFVNASDAAKAHAAKKGALVDNRALNIDFANKRSNEGQQDRAQSRAKSFGDSTSPPSDTLFVGNLSFDVGQETVSEAFGEWGTILGVRLPTDRDTGEPKGFGYVTFASVDEAKAALENMQGAEIAGRACRLDFGQPRPQNGEAGGRGGRGGGRGGFAARGGGRGNFSDRGGRGGRGRGGFGDRGGRGGRGGTTNRGGFGDFAGKKVTF